MRRKSGYSERHRNERESFVSSERDAEIVVLAASWACDITSVLIGVATSGQRARCGQGARRVLSAEATARVDRFARRGDQDRVTPSMCRQALTSNDAAYPRCSANRALAGAVAEFHDQPLDDREQRADLDLDHAPNYLEIHTEIMVNQLVAHAGNPAPRNRRRLHSRFGCERLDRFTNDLEVPHNGILDHLGAEEAVPTR